jgi:hypothetical protein
MSGSPPLTPLMLIPLSLLSAEYPASWRAYRHMAPQDCSVVVGERGQLRELRRIRQGECVIQLLPVVGEAVVVAHACSISGGSNANGYGWIESSYGTKVMAPLPVSGLTRLS